MRGEEMRRGKLLLPAAVAAMLLAATGVALAANLYGTGGDDVIRAGSTADTIYGYDGADALFGKAGNDTLYGGLGNDHQKASLYDEVEMEYVGAGVRGGGGDDTIYGQEGDDDIEGNAGRDIVNDTSPNDADRAWGGSENDALDVADGDTADRAACGEDPAGRRTKNDRDRARIDVFKSADHEIRAADEVASNCEVVTDQAGRRVDVSKLS
jgi:Ca2+-binding RTX toxin-like protein